MIWLSWWPGLKGTTRKGPGLRAYARGQGSLALFWTGGMVLGAAASQLAICYYGQRYFNKINFPSPGV